MKNHQGDSTRPDIKVVVKYFALLREQADRHSEERLTSAKTAGELFQELALLHAFTLTQRNIQVAVNDEFKDFATALKENDEIVFIPPVAGG